LTPPQATSLRDVAPLDLNDITEVFEAGAGIVAHT